MRRAPSRAIRSCSSIAACPSLVMESRFDSDSYRPDCLALLRTFSISSWRNSDRIGEIHCPRLACRSSRRTVGMQWLRIDDPRSWSQWKRGSTRDYDTIWCNASGLEWKEWMMETRVRWRRKFRVGFGGWLFGVALKSQYRYLIFLDFLGLNLKEVGQIFKKRYNTNFISIPIVFHWNSHKSHNYALFQQRRKDERKNLKKHVKEISLLQKQTLWLVEAQG